ncbi:MAG: ferritin-like domain-containing protein [Thermomicrobiales bacterium]
MLATLLPTPISRQQAAGFEHQQRQLLITAGGIDTNGPAAYFLPYHGWPEHDEARSARSELSAAHGQWRSTGYTYTKSFEPNVVHLRWDSRFRYAESPADLESTAPAGTADRLVRWLHDLFHGECQTVDRMGWLLVDFPDLPWAMRMDMAQQAWEEARHIQLVAQLLEGLGAHLGSYPFQPYFGHRRRDHHHPVAHLVTGNIIGEGSAAAETNDALRLTRGWDNDWLRQGLEHLSGDEVVHINFGKKWSRLLVQEDHARYWEAGKAKALAGQRALEATKRAYGFIPDGIAGPARIEREFAALLVPAKS